MSESESATAIFVTIWLMTASPVIMATFMGVGNCYTLLGLWLSCTCVLCGVVTCFICSSRKTKEPTEQHRDNLEPGHIDPYTVWHLHHIESDVSESASNPTIPSVESNAPVVLRVVLPPDAESTAPSASPPPYEEPPAYHTVCDEMRRSEDDAECRVLRIGGKGTLV